MSVGRNIPPPYFPIMESAPKSLTEEKKKSQIIEEGRIYYSLESFLLYFKMKHLFSY
jgi:hypothetical protein